LAALRRAAGGEGGDGDAVDGATAGRNADAGEPAGPAGLAGCLLPLDAGLEDLPSLTLAAGDLPRVARGQAVRLTSGEPGESPVRLFDGAGRLVAVGRWRGGVLLPDKVLVDPESTGGLPGRAGNAQPGDDAS
jgi:hypothetical protein